MKLKFRSSLTNFNKFNPFDNASDAKPIDLSLKSRIKNFMRKSGNEFKASSNSLNSISSSHSINSISSISPTNSLNHQYDQACRSAKSINAINMCNVPPSPPNSIGEIEDEDEFIYTQHQSNYYNESMRKLNNNTLTDLLTTSHLNQTNEIINQLTLRNMATNLSALNRKQVIYNQLIECNSKNIQQKIEQSNIYNEPSLNQSIVLNNNDSHTHYHHHKEMVRKHTLQMNRQRSQYNPYSQTTKGLNLKRKFTKNVYEENEDDCIQQELEDINYYDSTRLVNELRMKYCNTKNKKSNYSAPTNHLTHLTKPILSTVRNNSQLQQAMNPINIVSNSATNFHHNLRTDYCIQKKNIDYLSTTNNIHNNQLNNTLPDTNLTTNLQALYKQYYNCLLSQTGANCSSLSALQILMKNALEQNNNHLNCKEEINQFEGIKKSNSSTSIETRSLSSLSSSTPSPNNQQMNFNSLYNNDLYLPSTPSSLKDGQTNENTSPIQHEERKRSTRPLTGRHVRQGTGASPTTLANLKLAIKERQKCSTTKRKTK